MRGKNVLTITILLLLIVLSNSLLLAETGIKEPSTYKSNGDLINGWNWLRDSALNDYAEWTFHNITPGTTDLVLDITALATDKVNGGRGFDAKFKLIYGFPGSGGMGGVFKTKTVTIPNVSSPSDPLGYICKGQVTIDRDFIPGAAVIFIRIERESPQDNHIAFKQDSIVIMGEVEEAIEEEIEDQEELDVVEQEVELREERKEEKIDIGEEIVPIQEGDYTGFLGNAFGDGKIHNDDNYQIYVEKGQLISLQLTIPGNASYHLALFNPSRSSRGSSITQLDTKTLEYVADSTGIWYIKVSRTSGEGKYQLSVDIENQNDADSGRDAGDSYQEAIPISDGTFTGLLKAGDNDDYYSIEVEKGQLISLQLTIPGNASYHLALFNPSRSSRGSSITQLDTKTLEYVADSTGIWYIKVSRTSGEGKYQLSVDIENQNDADSGRDAGDSYQEAIPISDGTFTGLLKAGDNDDYYSIEVEKGQLISLQLTIPGNASYHLALFNPSRSSRGSSITQLDTKTLEYVADSTGIWYIKVSRTSGEGKYQLDIEIP